MPIKIKLYNQMQLNSYRAIHVVLLLRTMHLGIIVPNDSKIFIDLSYSRFYQLLFTQVKLMVAYKMIDMKS